MKASELRIGNNLNNEGDVITIDAIQEQQLSITGEHYWTKIRYFEPIELTEKLLLKLGFELNYKSNFSITYGHIENNKFSYKFNIPENKSWLEYHGGAIECKYVHQLQNLYFALTGVELQLSST